MMAALATIALEQAMLEPGASRARGLAWTVGLFLIPALVAAWALQRYQMCADSRANGSRRTLFSPSAGVGLLMLFILPFGSACVRIAFTGRAPMAEETLIGALRNLGLGLAAMGHRGRCARLSALASLFLATVASSVGGDGGFAVLAPIGGFALAGTLWLILVYWESLGLLASPRVRVLPASAFAWTIAIGGVLAAIAAIAAIGPTRAATALAGLVPSSGGTDWNDADARSGVGDGDNEVSASENPQSVGFTDSEIYLETDRPSLYDAFNETYGEPIKPKKQEKMIALGFQDVIEQKERPNENLNAGREFSEVRRKPPKAERRPPERSAKALVYIKGPTPLHVPLTSFSHFDGTTWSEEPCCDRRFPAEVEPRSHWLKMPEADSPIFAGSVAHQVKIGTLESSQVPVPPHLVRFKVGSVDRLDFFGWAQLGIVRMVGRTVPAGTMIDSESRTVDPEVLRAFRIAPRAANTDDHHVSFLNRYAVSREVAALAKRIVADVPEGWQQVEAVIAAIRQGYTLNRGAVSRPECVDVVADFLLRSGEGPDYLFASSAVVLLRELGYPTRLISGLYAAPDRYDPVTRHTLVASDDVHFWAEVRLPNGLWIVIEPTPGYELLPPARNWSAELALALAMAGMWARDHSVGLLAAFATLLLIFVRRYVLLDRCATLCLRLIPPKDSRRFVVATLKLIERRARWAGRPRPSGLTLARWYTPVARRAPGERRGALEGLVELADWAVYAPDLPGSTGPLSGREIEKLCRLAIRDWTLGSFRHAMSSRSGKDGRS
jgi:hypothetical protein